MCHHTASSMTSGNIPSLRVVTEGRSDVPGPLAQFLLGRDGTVYIITGEGANHAGTGGPVSVIRKDMGNYDAWGIEAENNGIGESWPAVQLQAYYRLCAALLALMGTRDVSRVVGHKEYTIRKIDPNGIDMDQFRNRVASAFNVGVNRRHVKLSSLRVGRTNNHVPIVKNALIRRIGSKFNMSGPYRNHWGRGAEEEYKKWQRHLGYKPSNINGKPSKYSLNKLGIDVVPEAVHNQGDINFWNVNINGRSRANRRVKKALREYGFGPVTMSLSNSFGKSAVKALVAFQRNIGHPQRGVIDASTLEALGFDVVF